MSEFGTTSGRTPADLSNRWNQHKTAERTRAVIIALVIAVVCFGAYFAYTRNAKPAGIDNLQFGMSPEQVKSAVGEPLSRETTTSSIGGVQAQMEVWEYSGGVKIGFLGGTVRTISTKQ